MPAWLAPTMAALVLFGLWGFFSKLTVFHLDYRSALVYQTIGSVLAGLVVLVQLKFQPVFHLQGMAYAVLTGIAGVTGSLFYFAAASRGKISLVVSVTALYPLITIVLAALFLKEPLSARQLAGMGCALAAILLMSN